MSKQSTIKSEKVKHAVLTVEPENRPAIFITGAATGIGLACAQYFAQQGWFVGLFDIDHDNLVNAAQTLQAKQCITGYLNVTDPASWDNALTLFWQHSQQRLDVLLNNAGVLTAGSFDGVALQHHRAMLDVNVQGMLNGCYSAFEYLKQTAQAQVINMASATAIYGQPEFVTYSATKFAVRGFSEALDIEWQKHGIRVKAVWPSFVNTQMLKKFEQTYSAQKLGIQLSALDVAKAVWQCAQSTSSYAKTHWRVGLQTKLLFWATSIAPNVLTKWVVKRIAS